MFCSVHLLKFCAQDDNNLEFEEFYYQINKMKNTLLFLFGLIFLISCKSEPKNEAPVMSLAQEIISKSISSSGGGIYGSSTVSFTFRDKKYIGTRDGSEFNLTRTFQDSLGEIIDTYSNDEFVRTIDSRQVIVADTMIGKYEESINSVFYFALLPYKLDDDAVIKKYLGETELQGKSYHKIKVNFTKEGGGTDFDDNYIYWVDKETNFIDYLAYDYQTNGGGMRFRVNYNERIVNGVRFVDAINMKPKVKNGVPLEEVDIAFESGELVELSKIILEDIEVKNH